MLWISSAIGIVRTNRTVQVVLLMLIAAVVTFTVAKCTGGKDTSQIEQTSRSGEAISDAAASAIGTIGNRTATDATIDAAVANAAKEIDNAQSVDALRNSVIASVCAKSSHRNDPACKVR
jgi:hypothetical protein